MKIPAAKAQPTAQPRPPVPMQYLAMAAAHMQNLGKQVFEPAPQTPVIPDAPSK